MQLRYAIEHLTSSGHFTHAQPQFASLRMESSRAEGAHAALIGTMGSEVPSDLNLEWYSRRHDAENLEGLGYRRSFTCGEVGFASDASP